MGIVGCCCFFSVYGSVCFVCLQSESTLTTYFCVCMYVCKCVCVCIVLLVLNAVAVTGAGASKAEPFNIGGIHCFFSSFFFSYLLVLEERGRRRLSLFVCEYKLSVSFCFSSPYFL